MEGLPMKEGKGAGGGEGGGWKGEWDKGRGEGGKEPRSLKEPTP